MQEIHKATEQVGRLTEFGREYAEEKVHLSKLEAAQKTVQVASEVTSRMIAFVFGLFALLSLEGALFCIIRTYLDSLLHSFLIIGGLNLLLAVLVMLFRRRIISNTILPYFIRLIFQSPKA